jgi:hypothetical protein
MAFLHSGVFVVSQYSQKRMQAHARTGHGQAGSESCADLKWLRTLNEIEFDQASGVTSNSSMTGGGVISGIFTSI